MQLSRRELEWPEEEGHQLRAADTRLITSYTSYLLPEFQWAIIYFRRLFINHFSFVNSCHQQQFWYTTTSSFQQTSIPQFSFWAVCPHQSVWIWMANRNQWFLLVYQWLHLWTQIWAFGIPFFLPNGACLQPLVSSLHIHQIGQWLTI